MTHSNLRVAVLLPTHGRFEQTRHFVESLSGANGLDFTFIISDSFGCCELQSFCAISNDLYYIKIPLDFFWAAAVNECLVFLHGLKPGFDCFVVANNDTYIPDTSCLYSAFEYSHTNNCICAPLVFDSSRSTRLAVSGFKRVVPGLILFHRPFYNSTYNPHLQKKLYLVELDVCGFQFTILPYSLMDLPIDHFLIPSRILPHYHADGLWSFILRTLGYRIVLHPSLQLVHNTDSTGPGNRQFHRYSLIENLRFAFNKRSPRYIPSRFKYIFSTTPVILLPINLMLELVKLLIISIP